MVEKERKFLLTELPKYIRKGSLIEQGYLILGDDRHLRVRIVNRKEAFLAFKINHSDTTRIEYEYEIPLEDAEEMLNNTEVKLIKMRYKSSYKGNTVDIDLYPDGMAVVEIEYEGETLENIPKYCGEEVTGKEEYSNINIALRNSGII
jgi:adenylate cyclase